MGVSRHRKGHKEKLAEYKATAKREQESFRKKMMDHYMKMQQDALANQESHTSTEDVSGPEIDIEELNSMDELNTMVEVETIIDELNVIQDETQPLDK